MRKIKKTVAILLAAALGLGLMACGSGGTKAPGKTEIRFSTWDSAETNQLQKSMVDKFNAQSETVHVTLESYGDSYDTKITASMGGKDAPDVMYMWNYPKYGEALLPLNERIEKEGAAYRDNFFEGLWNYNKIGDQILGIPIGYTTHVLYYNIDLFEKAGLPLPTDEWSWDEARAVAKKLSKPEDKSFGLAIPVKPDPYDFEMFAWSNGGAFCKPDGTVAGALNSPESVAPFALFQDMIKEGSAVATDGSGSNEFKTGKVAMFINGGWSIGGLKEAKMNFGVALLPDFGSRKSQSVVSSSGISISKFSKKQDAAWEFVKFWTGEAMNKERIDHEMPVLKSVVQSEKLSEDPIKSKFYTMLERSNEHMPTSFLVKDWSSLSEKITLAMEQVLNPNEAKDPQLAFDTAAK